MVLRWVFSGSSVNHVFSEKEPKSYRDKEEGQETVNATVSVVFSAHRTFGTTIFFQKKQSFGFVERNSDMIKICSRMCCVFFFFLMEGKYHLNVPFHLCNVTYLLFVEACCLLGQQTCRSPVKENLFHCTKLQVNTFNFTSFNLFEGLQAFGLMQLSFLIEGEMDSLA